MFQLLTTVHGRDDSNKPIKLKVCSSSKYWKFIFCWQIHSEPAGSVQDVTGFLKLTEGLTLNLTCEVI